MQKVLFLIRKNVAKTPSDPDFESAIKYSNTPKIVFSKTIKKSIWKNTEIANGDLVEEITKLKNQSGDEIIVYGGVTFVTSLITANLIDEFHLFINLTAIANGMTIFKRLHQN